MMNTKPIVYVAGSIRGSKELPSLVESINRCISGISNAINISAYKADQDISDKMIYCRDMEWLNASRLVIADVTNPSLGVGYEIGVASASKPVICLYHPGARESVSAMILGNPNITVLPWGGLEEEYNLLQTLVEHSLAITNGRVI